MTKFTCGVAGPARQGRGGRNDLPRALALFWAAAPFRAPALTSKNSGSCTAPIQGSCRGPERYHSHYPAAALVSTGGNQPAASIGRGILRPARRFCRSRAIRLYASHVIPGDLCRSCSRPGLRVSGLAGGSRLAPASAGHGFLDGVVHLEPAQPASGGQDPVHGGHARRSGKARSIKVLLRTPAAAPAQYLRMRQEDRGTFCWCAGRRPQDATVFSCRPAIHHSDSRSAS
jgi:hypothetical protein